MDTQDTLTPAQRESLLRAVSLGNSMALRTVGEAMVAARPHGHAAMVEAAMAVIAQSLAPSVLDTPEVLH